jgi:hypothetical protein
MPELDRARFEKLAADCMEREFDRIPRMRDFHAGTWTDRDYYVRDLVETILRIRYNNEVSAYALFSVGSNDDKLAAHLARYLAEEYGHEHMFLQDLDKFGVSKGDVDETPPFPATGKLMGYLRLTVDHEGPMPTAVWDWYAEWYANRYYQAIVDKARAEFGAEFVRGTQAHIAFDDSHEHLDLTFRVLNRAVRNWSSPAAAERHLATSIELVGEYFREVHQATTGAREDDAARIGASVG